PVSAVSPIVRLCRSPRPTLFPYTTLFRSQRGAGTSDAAGLRQHRAALGRDGRALPDARGRVGAPGDERSGRALVRPGADQIRLQDRKSTRLNSSHVAISYAVFCLKKKKDI